MAPDAVLDSTEGAPKLQDMTLENLQSEVAEVVPKTEEPEQHLFYNLGQASCGLWGLVSTTWENTQNKHMRKKLLYHSLNSTFLVLFLATPWVLLRSLGLASGITPGARESHLETLR